jgi:hypothetical protein
MGAGVCVFDEAEGCGEVEVREGVVAGALVAGEVSVNWGSMKGFLANGTYIVGIVRQRRLAIYSKALRRAHGSC